MFDLARLYDTFGGATMTPEECDSLLVMHTGMTWEQIAAEHEMHCGRCRGQRFLLETVTSTTHIDWSWPDVRLPFTWTPSRHIITLTLQCEGCHTLIDMPLHTREK